MKHIIYQVLPRLWGNGKFSAWDVPAFNYVRSLGADCIWFTGVPRHASGLDFVKGDPGSPYSIENWYEVNSYLADNPERGVDEFSDLVCRAHACGLKVITDYIPNHVSRNYAGAIPTFDHCDFDWTDTLKVDWTSPATVAEMAAVLKFWARVGVDGFRCDMVELVPSDALSEVIGRVREQFPELMFIAEVYDRNNYSRYLNAGFDLLYDKSGTYDILRRIYSGNGSAEELTWNWQFLGEMQPGMLNFLENHDEQRLCSSHFALSPERTRAMLAFSMLYGDASFMLYFGQEMGESASESDNGRTSIFNWTTVTCERYIQSYIKSGKLPLREKRTLEMYRYFGKLARSEEFFRGLCWDLGYCNSYDKRRVFAFVRYTSSSAHLVVCNFGAEKLAGLTIFIPSELSSRIDGKISGSVEVNVDEFGCFIGEI